MKNRYLLLCGLLVFVTLAATLAVYPLCMVLPSLSQRGEAIGGTCCYPRHESHVEDGSRGYGAAAEFIL